MRKSTRKITASKVWPEGMMRHSWSKKTAYSRTRIREYRGEHKKLFPYLRYSVKRGELNVKVMFGNTKNYSQNPSYSLIRYSYIRVIPLSDIPLSEFDCNSFDVLYPWNPANICGLEEEVEKEEVQFENGGGCGIDCIQRQFCLRKIDAP